MDFGDLTNISHIRSLKERQMQEVLQLAKIPYKCDFNAILALKRNAVTLLLRVAQLAMLSAGTNGYFKDCAVSKLLMESYFTAIVTPSLKHIEKALKK